ncbi:amidophosphoribosyltransferase [Ruminococcus sp. Marseille-P6503]|uniref:amidophosphoribosyltransferase n=1 Tax=Ruminococcus sp. Marseille-P6503 TaxID=2364796 RepID=UPI000F53C925|nr:amidophosphoribosyltransferase [Ruminococcus sp. Marseille-P6503]
MFDSIHEECGVFGIYTDKTSDVAAQTYVALYALQHRGQESCGIVVNDDGVFRQHKNLGLVNQVFDKDTLERLGQGNIAIGHVRYSTTGNCNAANAQPLVVRHVKGPLAIAHNGNLTNARELREKYENKGMIFHTTNDTEAISYAVTEERLSSPSIEAAVEKTMDKIKGAYSLVIMSPSKLIAVRDPNGFRPLSLGKIDGGYVVSSETCAFDSIGAEFIRDIKPGEIVIIDKNGLRSVESHCGGKGTICVFEYVYFARPDSVIEGSSVHKARLRAGKYLWREHPVDADIVIGVPDSGLDAALGFSQESGIPYGIGFIKNRYIGRTFIQPTQKERTNSVKIKLNAVSNTVKGKRVVMIDDSIVRGTTSARIVRLLRDAGAKEVHVRISSPPFVGPCYFGTDIDSKDKLIACRMTNEEICRHLGADSLGYLSVESVKKLAGNSDCDFCVGCFNEKYPIEVPKEMPKDKFEYRISENK